ncbi:MAG: hypothetical protein ABIH69_07610 [bacterium]
MMKSYIITLFLLIVITGCGQYNPFEKGSPQYLAGNVGEIVLTKSDSPYYVFTDVIFKKATIEEGVLIKFYPGVSFSGVTGEAELYVNGTREDPVVFSSFYATSEGYWHGLNIGGIISVKYAVIENAIFGAYIHPTSYSLLNKIENSQFRNCLVGLCDKAGINISYSDFYNNKTGVDICATSLMSYNNVRNNGVGIFLRTKGAFIHDNNIYNNLLLNLQLDGQFALSDQETQEVDVVDNYWGFVETDSIEENIWDMDDDSRFSIECYGRTKYDPFKLSLVENAGVQ